MTKKNGKGVFNINENVIISLKILDYYLTFDILQTCYKHVFRSLHGLEQQSIIWSFSHMKD